MKKSANLFILLFAAAFILTAAAVTVLREKETTSYYENRALAAMPTATLQNLSDGSFTTSLEKYLCDHAAGRNTITKLGAEADMALRRPVVNDVVIGDTLLPFNDYEAVDEREIEEDADAISENLARVASVTESCGGHFCYVAVPCQYAYFSDRYPWFLNSRSEYTAASLDALENALDEKGVSFLDLGEIYAAEGWPENYSSDVDNHFSIFGAYEAYAAILNKLNESGGPGLTVIQKDQLNFQPVESYYMGSRTRKLFNLIENSERLYTAAPVTPVPFVRYNNGSEGSATVYSYPASGSPVTYSFYMGGDVAETEIDTDRPDLPTVLIYGDSFTNAVECILYLSCDKMYSLDMRHYTGGTVSEFIEETRPDYVICLRDYEALLSTEYNGGV
jgi:hypothetical protein